MDKYDFSGYATKNDLRCSDGRTILKDAFKENHGDRVPLVWQHLHNEPANILGHALLENKPDGVYAYCVFNDTEAGKNAKQLVEHGDITHLSIYANSLKQKGSAVMHGVIREVSLVLSGANPGALIDNLAFKHSDGSYEEDDSEAIIYTESSLEFRSDEVVKHADGESTSGKTIQDVVDGMTDEQKNVMFAFVAEALQGTTIEHQNGNEEEREDETMKHNMFDQTTEDTKENSLKHDDVVAIFSDVKRHGSLKESALAHGITNIEYLFPEAQTLTNVPAFIQRDMGWVNKVMSGVHHTPFSRIKSVFADITEDEARARGYIKGKQKKDEVFSLLKRTTSPVTIYKKQKLDRDDVIDITDFDVVSWMKGEMRMMLDEEIARAILIGDGRLGSSDDKINEQNVRPVWKDDDIYTIKHVAEGAPDATASQKAKAFIRAVVKSRKDYKGSGEPTLFTTEDVITDCLLMEDNEGRIIYDSVTKLATVLRVKEIVTVPVMESQTRQDGEGKTRALMGIILNLNDYNVGADKGGAVNMFDDFDIDYNAQKYLIETRISGALTKPFSAIAIEYIVNAAG